MVLSDLFIFLAIFLGIYSFLLYWDEIAAEDISVGHQYDEGSTDENLHEGEPHPITFLIWISTQAVATAGMIEGRSFRGYIYYLIGTVLYLGILGKTLKRQGLKNVSKLDVIAVIGVVIGSIVTWQIMPLSAVGFAGFVEWIAFWFTFRKLWNKPRSEPVKAWVISTASNIFAILALDNYNELTLTYVLMVSLGNFLVIGIALVRRRFVT